jgi:hypothetical protein
MRPSLHSGRSWRRDAARDSPLDGLPDGPVADAERATDLHIAQPQPAQPLGPGRDLLLNRRLRRLQQRRL